MFQCPGNNDDRRAGSMTSPRRGSVLVPVVAAMLILMLMGVALSELFAAQRMQSVLGVESEQAFWIAEAGLWHAAHEGTALSTAVTFAGGDYTVTKSGDDYTATASSNDATRVVTLTLTGGDPLDEAASVATASTVGNKKITMDLVSISGSDALISTFDLSDDAAAGDKLESLRLSSASADFYLVTGGTLLPTGVLSPNNGTCVDRTIAAGASPSLTILFKTPPTPVGTIQYTLVLNFADSTTSTLTFTVTW